MRSAALLSVLLSLAFPAVVAAQTSNISGVVLGPKGQPLAGANVEVRGSSTNAATDSLGRFQLNGNFKPPIVLEISLPGFITVEKTVTAAPSGGWEPIEIRLQLEVVQQNVQVTEALPRTESPDHIELDHLKIVSTAGSKGDVFLAVQMLPGVAQMNDNAGLYVRGGDVSETSTYINHSLLPHPYRYETPTGGLFGAVDTFFIEGVSLSAGGFPARYGNSMSGVLELNTLPRPEKPFVFVNVGLAAAAVNISSPLGKHAGLRLAGNRSATETLFKVNPPEQKFYKYPGGYDVSGEFYYESKSIGHLNSYFFRSEDSVSLQIETGSFSGPLSSNETNELYSVRWERPLPGGWLANGSVSFSSMDKSTAAGALALRTLDQGGRGRIDLFHAFRHGVVRVGFDSERLHEEMDGSTPRIGGDLGGIQGVLAWNQSYPELRVGGYAEYEVPLTSRISLNVGARTDAYRKAGAQGFDPRAALQYAFRSHQKLRLAWGVYHQLPAISYFDSVNGNPYMGLMRAQHVVLGYSYGEESSRFYLKLEGYDKQYSRLPLQAPVVNFTPTGDGYARGFDSLIKGRLGRRIEGWASYSYVMARRRWTPVTQRNQFPTPAEPVSPDFDIPHTIQLTASGQLPKSISLGASLRVASGKPFTPVVGANPVYDSATHALLGYAPVYGLINSQRYPTYARIDLNVSRPFSAGDRAVFRPYLGISNLTNRKNIFEYYYSSDYSERRPALGARGRTYYFGILFQI